MWQTEKQRSSLPLSLGPRSGVLARDQNRLGPGSGPDFPWAMDGFPLNSGWISPDFPWSYQPAFLTSRLRLRLWLNRRESKHGIFFINIRYSWRLMAQNTLFIRQGSEFLLYYEIVNLCILFGAAGIKSPSQENCKFTIWSEMKRSDRARILFSNIIITNLNKLI